MLLFNVTIRYSAWLFQQFESLKRIRVSKQRETGIPVPNGVICFLSGFTKFPAESKNLSGLNSSGFGYKSGSWHVECRLATTLQSKTQKYVCVVRWWAIFEICCKSTLHCTCDSLFQHFFSIQLHIYAQIYFSFGNLRDTIVRIYRFNRNVKKRGLIVWLIDVYFHSGITMW